MKIPKLHLPKLSPKALKIVSWCSVIIAIILASYAGAFIYSVIVAKPGESVQAPIIGKIEKPSREIKTFKVVDGNIVAYYTDNTSDVVGKIPTSTATIFSPEVVKTAVQDYCSDGHCDGKAPSSSVVTSALVSFCDKHDDCMGKDGTDGTDGSNATQEMVNLAVKSMIGQAVADYCSNHNNCKGDTGNTGPTGASGKDAPKQQTSCVMRWDSTQPGVTRYWEATKYSNQDNSAWVDFKRIRSEDRTLYPNCIDLRV